MVKNTDTFKHTVIEIIRGFDESKLDFIEEEYRKEVKRIWEEEDVPDIYRLDGVTVIDLQFIDSRLMIVYAKGNIVIFYEGEPNSLRWVVSYVSEKKRDPSMVIFHVIHSELEYVNSYVLNEHKELSRLESMIVEGKPSTEVIKKIYSHIVRLLEIKRNLVYFRQSLSKIKYMYSDYQISELDLSISEGLTLIDLSVSVANSMMDIYDKTLSMELNILIKRLTAVSIILAVLTIITGMWGMNFANIPLYYHPSGFWIVTLFMAVVFILMSIIFRKIGWM